MTDQAPRTVPCGYAIRPADFVRPVLSFSQALEAVAARRAMILAKKDYKDGAGRAGAQSERGEYHFTKTADLADAIKLATFGWPEGSAKLVRAAAYAVLPDRAPDTHLSVAGMYPDVAAFCAGAPEHMVCASDDYADRGARPLVTIYAQALFSGGTDTDTITAVGAALLSAIDALEAGGTSVKLVHLSVNSSHYTLQDGSTSDRRHTVAHQIVVKDHGEPADIDRLAFVLAHPSMLRRFWFALYEADPVLRICTNDKHKNGGGYGRVPDFVPSQLADEPGAVFLPVIGSQYGGAAQVVTEDSAGALIKKTLQASGVRVFW